MAKQSRFEKTETGKRVYETTLACIGGRMISEDEVMDVIRGVGRHCGYIHGIDTPKYSNIAKEIIWCDIPKQIT